MSKNLIHPCENFDILDEYQKLVYNFQKEDFHSKLKTLILKMKKKKEPKF